MCNWVDDPEEHPDMITSDESPVGSEMNGHYDLLSSISVERIIEWLTFRIPATIVRHRMPPALLRTDGLAFSLSAPLEWPERRRGL